MSDTKDTKETPAVQLSADDRVKLLFEKLQQKKAEVATAERPSYITGGMFRYSESLGNPVDITTIRDERKLVEILTFLKERSDKYVEAAQDLGVAATFTWMGFTQEEWFTDLKTRVNVLQIAKRKTELAELEARINKVVTPELRRQMEMDALEAELGK